MDSQDKCHYCGSTKDLGIETATKRVQCVDCAVDDEAKRRKERRRVCDLTGHIAEYK